MGTGLLSGDVGDRSDDSRSCCNFCNVGRFCLVLVLSIDASHLWTLDDPYLTCPQDPTHR
jgi:hypothetical protein